MIHDSGINTEIIKDADRKETSAEQNKRDFTAASEAAPSSLQVILWTQHLIWSQDTNNHDSPPHEKKPQITSESAC